MLTDETDGVLLHFLIFENLPNLCVSVTNYDVLGDQHLEAKGIYNILVFVKSQLIRIYRILFKGTFKSLANYTYNTEVLIHIKHGEAGERRMMLAQTCSLSLP